MEFLKLLNNIYKLGLTFFVLEAIDSFWHLFIVIDPDDLYFWNLLITEVTNIVQNDRWIFDWHLVQFWFVLDIVLVWWIVDGRLGEEVHPKSGSNFDVEPISDCVRPNINYCSCHEQIFDQ